MTQIFFETERLIARSLDMTDLKDIVAYRSDPEVAKYQDWKNFTLENGRNLITDNLKHRLGDPCWYQIGIERKDDGVLIGDCGLRIFANDHHRAQIGYTFGKDHWGQGYATEAVGALIDYAFHRLGVQQIMASAHPENLASQNVLRKSKFLMKNETFEGLWPGDVVYALRIN
ncbi:MAG TPA: GNAT family N-acetyltransferase [Alphaproteobacteria bacterium]